jgi:hypothetical protein
MWEGVHIELVALYLSGTMRQWIQIRQEVLFLACASRINLVDGVSGNHARWKTFRAYRYQLQCDLGG